MFKIVVRMVVGLVLLVCLPLFSLAYLLVLSPWLLTSLFLKDIQKRGDRLSIQHRKHEDGIVFDRVHDVSKLYGCNTRNIAYRWSIFESVLSEMADVTRKTALDFGAGSLRDTWELAKLGFTVTALDINTEQLNQSRQKYDWNACKGTILLLAQPIESLNPDKGYDLITAFDVLEHVGPLEIVVNKLYNLLVPGGFLLITVPNGRSVRERIGRLIYLVGRATGLLNTVPGIYHVNFKSQKEWHDYFRAKGFTVYRHDMTIGPNVNNWHYLHVLPIALSGIQKYIPKLDSEKLLCPSWLMRRLDLIDQRLKESTHRQWGWNLIVLTRE